MYLFFCREKEKERKREGEMKVGGEREYLGKTNKAWNIFAKDNLFYGYTTKVK